MTRDFSFRRTGNGRSAATNRYRLAFESMGEILKLRRDKIIEAFLRGLNFERWKEENNMVTRGNAKTNRLLVYSQNL